MMFEAVSVAGLDLCDTRRLYRENRTSTPTRRRICSRENADCWDNHVVKYDKMEPILCPDLTNSPFSTTMSSDPNASKESHPEIDLSYGGQWATEPPESQPQPQSQPPNLPDLVEDLPDLVDGLYNFGISVFDSSDDQVSNNFEGGEKISPKCPKNQRGAEMSKMSEKPINPPPVKLT